MYILSSFVKQSASTTRTRFGVSFSQVHPLIIVDTIIYIYMFFVVLKCISIVILKYRQSIEHLLLFIYFYDPSVDNINKKLNIVFVRIIQID